ncbi:MAG: DNA polymerase III subunit delta [Legionellales bacterium]|nr:DNA polymerase III subunit delta [Legionellales bacterium]|tara:strand:- start:2066 stop:3097 length:1032 start_codon:yes stop_codon:yes gene_type:complete
MRLRPEQLEMHLQRTALGPIYFVSGDEPLQKLECVDQIRASARTQGYDERIVFNVDKSFDWYSINQATDNLSLFSSRRIIELRMSSPKPGKEGGRVLSEYAEQINKDNLLVITSEKVDKSVQNTKWFKAIEKKAAIIQVWPINSVQLSNWIQSSVQAKQKRLSLDAARLIAQRVEGNMLAAKQEIEKLVLLVDKDDIDIEDVINAVADSSRFDVFDMIESAFLGDSDRTLIMLHGLKNEGTEPMALFGALMWEFRRVCTIAHQHESGVSLENLFHSYRLWDQKKRPMNAVLKRHSSKSLDQLLNYCALIDKTLKSSQKSQVWDQFNILLLAIAGINMTNFQKV